MIGVNVGDILHPQDYGELGNVFQSQGNDTEQVSIYCLVMYSVCALNGHNFS